jgi:uridine phosphorylase
MSQQFSDTDLILNPDGSIYHLHLLPHQLANNVILVGDPDRVPIVSSYFDSIAHRVQKREFVTHTGTYKGKSISVVSTGIGTDNIDIVLNELDALVNIDLETRMPKQQHTPLNIARVGTSGALQADIPIDTILCSSYGLGLDSLMQFYCTEADDETEVMLSDIDGQLNLVFITPYLFKAPGTLYEKFAGNFRVGITATCPGFYAPQGRKGRFSAMYGSLMEILREVVCSNGMRITNFEMETAGIYGLATELGHEAVSVNAIVANRVLGEFSTDPELTIRKAIEQTLSILVQD